MMKRSSSNLQQLGPAKFCANCFVKVANCEPKENDWYGCKCQNCQSLKFSRCGRCHIMPYCSRDCQLEHWSSHKKICKKFSKGDQVQEDTMRMFRIAFNGFAFETLPPRVPFPFKLDTKHHHGWIDEYLACLIHLLGNLVEADSSGSIPELMKLYRGLCTL